MLWKHHLRCLRQFGIRRAEPPHLAELQRHHTGNPHGPVELGNGLTKHRAAPVGQQLRIDDHLQQLRCPWTAGFELTSNTDRRDCLQFQLQLQADRFKQRDVSLRKKHQLLLRYESLLRYRRPTDHSNGYAEFEYDILRQRRSVRLTWWDSTAHLGK